MAAGFLKMRWISSCGACGWTEMAGSVIRVGGFLSGLIWIIRSFGYIAFGNSSYVFD